MGLTFVCLDIIIIYDHYRGTSVADAQPYRVLEYLTRDQRNPYREWLLGLSVSVRARIQARVWRFEQGNLGDSKTVGEGVWEARCDFGPGYRVYFGIDGRRIIVLLVGGQKRGQSGDIRRAKLMWHDYLFRRDPVDESRKE